MGKRSIICIACMIFGISIAMAVSADNVHKSRLIVTTDLGGSDPDDTQSMIHLLVCSDRVDLEGIISSQAWDSDPDKTPVLMSTVDEFISVLPNLRVHSPNYPSEKYLKSIVVRGQSTAHMDGVGDGQDSPGSELIVKALTNSDSRPVWLVAWGGMNTIAQAIHHLKSTLPADEFSRIIEKIRIYDILGQDDAGAYIAKTYPSILYIRNKEVYGWAPDDQWTKEHVQSIGQLGHHYPNRIWATEGDSPSFLYVIANGLNYPEHPDYGGWGGRFSLEKQKNIRGMDFIEKTGKSEVIYDDYYMIGSAPEGVRAIKLWESDIHNDFAARMIWASGKDYAEANHHPFAVVNHDNSGEPLLIDALAGDSIALSAEGSSDPDNDPLSYNWMIYKDPSSYNGEVTIEGSDSSECMVRIPASVAPGSIIHIILSLTDAGTPPLTSYRRIIIRVN